MRIILITSLTALALAGIVASCRAEVLVPTELATPTSIPSPTLTIRELVASAPPYPTRIPTPTPPGYPLTVTVRAGWPLTETAEAAVWPLTETAEAVDPSVFAMAATNPKGFARTVAGGENRHCSYQDYRWISVAIQEGKEILTGSEFAVLVRAATDAADCTAYPSHKDSEFLRCVRQSLVDVIPHYERIGAKPLKGATDAQSEALSAATLNSWNGLVSCHPSWVNLDPERERDWLLDLTEFGLY